MFYLLTGDYSEQQSSPEVCLQAAYGGQLVQIDSQEAFQRYKIMRGKQNCISYFKNVINVLHL